MKLAALNPYILAACAAFLLISSNGAGVAAPAGDWPCAQRKVEEITIAAIWPGPPFDPHAIDWKSDPEIAGLVDRLAARRTSEDEAKAAIAALAASAGDRKRSKLLALLAGLVERINVERASVIAGIERRGRAQKQFAENLRNENARLDALNADPKADQAKVAQMSDALNWDLRIFDDRQKSLRFVCEVPSLIEQRLFTLARAVEAALK